MQESVSPQTPDPKAGKKKFRALPPLLILGVLVLFAVLFWPRTMGRKGENYGFCLGYHMRVADPPAMPDGIAEPKPDYCFGIPLGRRY